MLRGSGPVLIHCSCSKMHTRHISWPTSTDRKDSALWKAMLLRSAAGQVKASLFSHHHGYAAYYFTCSHITQPILWRTTVQSFDRTSGGKDLQKPLCQSCAPKLAPHHSPLASLTREQYTISPVLLSWKGRVTGLRHF